MLAELTKEIERANADDYLIFGDFNESVCSPDMTKLMVDNGLHEIFGEAHNAKSEERDSTFEHGPNCTDAILGTEQILRLVQGIELTDFDKVIDTDHRGYVTDIDSEEYILSKMPIIK